MKTLYKFLSLVIIIAGLYLIFRTEEIIQPPGVLAPNPPKQTLIKPTQKWQKDGFNYTALAKFELQARVLNIRFYGSDDMSEFCPVDIAVGWNQMSDQVIVEKFNIKQQHRWYVWQTDNFPIPRKEVEKSSSNIHIIPATEKIEEIIDEVIKGNIIKLKGKLVNINKFDEKFTYKTSTNRKDTGGGACEIIWLEDITILK